MTNNIFRVLNEGDLEEILEINKFKVVVVMYSNKNCGPCKKIKPQFVSLAKEHPNSYFVYVDLGDFKITDNKYTKYISGTPQFVFYISNKYAHNILGPNLMELKKVTSELEFQVKKAHEASQHISHEKMLSQNMMETINEEPTLEQNIQPVEQQPMNTQQQPMNTQQNMPNQQQPMNTQQNIPNHQQPMNTQQLMNNQQNIPNQQQPMNTQYIDSRQEKLAKINSIIQNNNIQKMNQISALNQLSYAKQLQEQKEREKQILQNKMMNNHSRA